MNKIIPPGPLSDLENLFARVSSLEASIETFSENVFGETGELARRRQKSRDIDDRRDAATRDLRQGSTRVLAELESIGTRVRTNEKRLADLEAQPTLPEIVNRRVTELEERVEEDRKAIFDRFDDVQALCDRVLARIAEISIPPLVDLQPIYIRLEAIDKALAANSIERPKDPPVEPPTSQLVPVDAPIDVEVYAVTDDQLDDTAPTKPTKKGAKP